MDQNHLRPILGVNTSDQIPWIKIAWTKYLGPKLSFPRYTRLAFCESACVHIRDLYTYNLHVYTAWPMVNLHIPFFLHSYCLPTILWSFIWESCHQGQHLCHTYIIMPITSPFGLDGNNHTKSLSPFDINGKGSCSPWVHAEFSDMLKCVDWAPMIESMLPLSISKVCKKMF